MKALIIKLLSKLGKGLFGKLLVKLIPLLAVASIYLVAGILLKIFWKSFKKQFIPFAK